MSRAIDTNSEAETASIASELGASLQPGDVVLLTGPLGAGKTAFVRGLAQGLGCDPERVSSPTFTIIQEYPGTMTLQHVDLYRLTPAEVDDLGLDELMASAVVAVEWPDRWRHAPPNAIHVTLTPAGDTRRAIHIRRSPGSLDPGSSPAL